MTDTALGMAWYTPATWRELRAIPEAKIEMSYSQFVRSHDNTYFGDGEQTKRDTTKGAQHANIA